IAEAGEITPSTWRTSTLGRASAGAFAPSTSRSNANRNARPMGGLLLSGLTDVTHGAYRGLLPGALCFSGGLSASTSQVPVPISCLAEAPSMGGALGLALQAFLQLRTRELPARLRAQSLNLAVASLDVGIELLLMVIVVSERGVDLSQREVGVLCVNLLR